MIIRAETEADYPAVAEVNTAAFGAENEARLISLIRESELYVPELALVAVEGDEVMGYVMFSYMTLLTPDGDLPILDLAPLAVHPRHQNRGVGTALTLHGLDLIEERGEPLVLVEGIPSYYPRFGFEPASQHGLESPSPKIPDEAFMVKLLTNYHPRYRGRVRYPAAFYEAGAVEPQS